MVIKLTTLATLALVSVSMLICSGEASEPYWRNPVDQQLDDNTLQAINNNMIGNEFYSYFLMNYKTLFGDSNEGERSSRASRVKKISERFQRSPLEWVELARLSPKERGKQFPLLQAAWSGDESYSSFLEQFVIQTSVRNLPGYFVDVVPQLQILLNDLVPGITESDIRYAINEKGYEILFQHLLPQVLAVLIERDDDYDFLELVADVVHWHHQIRVNAPNEMLPGRWLEKFIFSATMINQRTDGDIKRKTMHKLVGYHGTAHSDAIVCINALYFVKRLHIPRGKNSLAKMCDYKEYGYNLELLKRDHLLRHLQVPTLRKKE
ncbi:hypothetical protein IWQ62_004584 [Dispira parvispora]|uniref:Uncharacterized protein n=1 Tax=Dispira parvispora TaxID=1520584 RepID=A0A9W8E1U5_9FUNG|nr:hypothetical protein IWQ62_004584 [Dispira parvispora]